jgi:hypothetical protein
MRQQSSFAHAAIVFAQVGKIAVARISRDRTGYLRRGKVVLVHGSVPYPLSLLAVALACMRGVAQRAREQQNGPNPSCCRSSASVLQQFLIVTEASSASLRGTVGIARASEPRLHGEGISAALDGDGMRLMPMGGRLIAVSGRLGNRRRRERDDEGRGKEDLGSGLHC